jgi:hypothetical protein
MIWQAPAALLGLVLVAGPVLVHLLARRRATRVLFPATRFVPAVQGAAVRLQRPSDLGLLCLRASAVAAAALASAQPILITPARQRAWASRVARAVVIDTSPSVRPSAAMSVAEGESRGVFESQRFASQNLREGIGRALTWLQSSGAARREIAIVSDFQRGSVGAGDFADVPAQVGLRFARAGAPSGAGGPLTDVEGWRGARWTPSLVLDAVGTQVTWTRKGRAGEAAVTVRAGPATQGAAGRALAAARSFGIPAGEPPTRVDIAFAGAPSGADMPPKTPWIAAAAIALAADPVVVASGAPLVIGERGGMLTARTPLSAESPVAPAIVRAVIVAGSPRVADPERETIAIDDATLAGWRRPSAARPGTVPPDVSDGRWLWGMALALVLIEGMVRNRRASRAVEEVGAHAA